MKPSPRGHRAVTRLGAAGITLMLSLGLAATPAVHAGNSVEQQVSSLLSHARSYEAVMDIKESGADSTPAESSFHMDEIVVRRGNLVETYSRMKVAGQAVEMAMKGNKICQGVAGHWQCDDMGAQFGALLKQTPEGMLKTMGVHMVYKPAGSRKIAGQTAVGYAFTATLPGLRETGTFWLDPSGARLIEMDSATTDNGSGKTTSTQSMKAVFTHWNDPGLKIPAVPGL